MIVLFTDYGFEGPYLGQVESRLATEAPEHKIINLMADAPRNNPRASAYLLASLVSRIPAGAVVFAVVDPGVGSGQDKPVVFQTKSHWFVGPDNGLFDLVLRNEQGIGCWEIYQITGAIATSFHGRDIYAPACASIANTGSVPGTPRQWIDTRHWPDDLYEIIYLDHFGNAMTGIRAGNVQESSLLTINGQHITHAETFAAVQTGEAFWYHNSNDLVEIAVNQGSAAMQLALSIGSPVTIV
ncbi:MAG: SAM-dependent chlorinase/fluorinase [Gammaproteobacteria bacterium]